MITTRRRGVLALWLVLSLLFASVWSMRPAYASDSGGGPPPGDNSSLDGIEEAKGEYKELYKSIYGIFRVAATSFGAVGVAISAVQMVIGDEESASKALSRIVILLGAIAALWLLPAIISMGIELGRQFAWDPSKLKG